jgi:prepilin-type N-terminal cleavage/methylation domain-containing protein
MKPTISSGGLSAFRAQRGFTLVEMLVVIAIIGLLAGMIVPLAGLATKKRNLARARAEVDSLALAIDTYKAKKGFYPPDNPGHPTTNQLFYELWGMVLQTTPVNAANPVFIDTFSANETIASNLLYQFFGSGGIVNASTDTNEIINFIPRINAAEIQDINPLYKPAQPPSPTANTPVWVFATPAAGPAGGLPIAPTGQRVNVIRYVCTNPTNNSTTYDLWVDLLIAGQTNRICNWDKDPEIVH